MEVSTKIEGGGRKKSSRSRFRRGNEKAGILRDERETLDDAVENGKRREGEEKVARANCEDISTKGGKGKRKRTSPDKEARGEYEPLWGLL